MIGHTAVSVTLHCLTGCATGEVLGLVLGTMWGMSDFNTIALSVALAFMFGYGLSVWPLVRAGITIGIALRIALAADTVSIATMELVDSFAMIAIPGAMDAGLSELVFWGSLAVALTAAFLAALPVNWYLLRRGLGHALIHGYHQPGHKSKRV